MHFVKMYVYSILLITNMFWKVVVPVQVTSVLYVLLVFCKTPVGRVA